MREAANFVKSQTSGMLFMAEVGVREGGNAEDMLKNLNIGILYLIDPYCPYREGLGFCTEEMQLEHMINMLKNLYHYFKKVVIIPQDSVFAQSLFKEESLDFVYIDGNHSYDYVYADCVIWWSKVKVGGWLAGHDFYNAQGYQVKDAVEKFAQENNLTIKQFNDTDWLIEKKGNEKPKV